MAFLRKSKKTSFTVIDSDIIRDDNLSLKDLGLLIRLLSLPDNWEFSENGLMLIFKKDKQGSIRTGLKNLERLGYLSRAKIRDDKGKYIGCDWIINEQPYLNNLKMDKLLEYDPSFENPSMGNPSMGNPSVENPRLENRPQYNINQDNINQHKIDQLNTNQSIYLSTDDLKERFEYDILIHNNPLDKDVIDEMVDIIGEVLNTNKEYVRVNGENKNREVVKSKFNKLNSAHLEYTIHTLSKTTTDIKNIRNYLITALYNAPSTIEAYYKQKVNHDLNNY